MWLSILLLLWATNKLLLLGRQQGEGDADNDDLLLMPIISCCCWWTKLFRLIDRRICGDRLFLRCKFWPGKIQVKNEFSSPSWFRCVCLLWKELAFDDDGENDERTNDGTKAGSPSCSSWFWLRLSLLSLPSFCRMPSSVKDAGNLETTVNGSYGTCRCRIRWTSLS